MDLLLRTVLSGIHLSAAEQSGPVGTVGKEGESLTCLNCVDVPGEISYQKQ